VTGNTAQVNQFDQLTVRKLPAPGAPQTAVREQHVLRQVSQGLARDTSLFVGSLPEGEYTFDRMVDVDTNRALNMGEGGRRLLGNFRVKAGARFGLARIRHSADEGATWRVEYSNFDRAVYEAEQKRKEAPEKK
jgi:hypothetical protein